MDSEQISTQLVRIETKLDRALNDIEEHDDDIKGLERRIWWFSGGIAVVALCWDSLKHKIFN